MVILARVACLGLFTFNYLTIDKSKINNHQKNRIDYSLITHSCRQKRIDLDDIKKYIPSENLDRYKYIYSLLEQELKDIFANANKNQLVLIMDSFSELTDKLFVNTKNGSCFLSHWRDIEHIQDFEDKYYCEGLLPIEHLRKYYIDFFSLFNRIYGNIPIIFINFPTALDSRNEYKIRGEIIEKIINDLSKTKFSNIYPIKADIVEPNPEDSSVYHFSNNTYKLLAKKISELNIEGIKFVDRDCLYYKFIKKIKLFLIRFIPIAKFRRNLRRKISQF